MKKRITPRGWVFRIELDTWRSQFIFHIGGGFNIFSFGRGSLDWTSWYQFGPFIWIWIRHDDLDRRYS
jgi:hypothetical protein